MTLNVTPAEGDIEKPTEHPHVFEEQVPAFHDDDDNGDDGTQYTISFGGTGAAVTFFAAVLKDRIDEDLYRFYENSPDANPSFFGISEDDIDEVINVFDTVVEEIEEIRIAGTIDGVEWSMTAWDGSVTDPDYLTA